MNNSKILSSNENHRRYDNEIPEDKNLMVELNYENEHFNIDHILNPLSDNLVVLVKKVRPENADKLMLQIATEFELEKNLKLQANYATLLGKRDNIGQFYMTPNKRTDYQFIPPHSESTRLANMQLASIYCKENDIQGGENILMRVDSSSSCWSRLKEKTARVELGEKPLTQSEIAKARAVLSIDPLKDILSPDDIILNTFDVDGSDAKFYDVLTSPQKSYSTILKKEVYPYWSNIAGVDFDSAEQYLDLLRKCNLFNEPPQPIDISKLDSVGHRRIYRSGVKYSQLFSNKITYYLEPGDFIIQNNLTWTHSANNYVPNSGRRDFAVAFA